MIPISTARWDPKWWHDFTGDYNYIFKDKRGIYNGLRAEILHLPDEYSCNCGKSCIEEPSNCSFLTDYYNYLNTLDFNYVIQNLERIANKIQNIEQFQEEPIIVLIVYETPSNPCSERVILKRWFKEHNYELKEFERK